MRRAFLFLIALASQAVAQIVGLQILAPSVGLTAGDTMQLTATGTLATGGVVPNAPVAWAVDQPSLATVDSTGSLKGIGIGIVKVTAKSGNLSHDALFQILPDAVKITPESAELEVGGQTQFRATAFDKAGNPIPGVPFTWAVVDDRFDYLSEATYGAVTASGMVTGVYEGQAYVRATYNYASAFGVLAGMQQQLVQYSFFRVTAPRPYSVVRQFDSAQQPRVNPQLHARPSLLYPLPDGRILFNASLDGLSTALLSWDGAQFQQVLATGLPSNSAGSIVTDIQTQAVNSQGQLLTQEVTTDGGLCRSGTADSLAPFLVNNSSAPGAENLSGFGVTRNSLSSGGAFVFRAGYRIPGTSTYVTGLFRGFGVGVSEILFSGADVTPELGIAGGYPNDFGVDNNGVAWYIATVTGAAVLYRHDAAGRKKVLAVGDPLLGSTVSYFAGSRNSSPGTYFAENGDVFIALGLQSGVPYLLHYSASDSTQPAETLRTSNTAAILGVAPDGSLLIFANPYPNKGDGVWLWKGNSLQPIVLLGQTKVTGALIETIESATVDASGRIVLMVRTPTNPMLVIAMKNGAPRVLFQSGDTVALSTTPMMTNFIPGARTGNPMFYGGSSTAASIVEFRDGSLQPVLATGDRIFGAAFPGINIYGQAQRTPNGDLHAILPGAGIGRYSGGKWELELPIPLKIADVTVGAVYRIAVNSSGGLAWAGSTDKGDVRIYLTQNGQHQLIYTNGMYTQTGAVIDGQPVASFDDFFLDDLNRVFVRVRFRSATAPVLYVWSQGTWTFALKLYETPIDGRAVTNWNALRAIGPHFFAALQNGAGTYIAEWTGSGWSTIMTPTDKMPTGFLLNNVFTHLEGDAAGGLAFVSQAYPSNALYVRRGGQTVTVLTTGRRTDDGDYLVNILSLDFRDDGSVRVLALNELSELVLYSAVLR